MKFFILKKFFYFSSNDHRSQANFILALNDKESVVCEVSSTTERLDLKCDSGLKIEINSAFYGKPDGDHDICSTAGTCSNRFFSFFY